MPIKVNGTDLKNVLATGSQLNKVICQGVTVWESYNKPYTFEYNDELSSSSTSIDKTYTLPDGLVTEVNAYFRYVHSNNNDCKMLLRLFDENGGRLVNVEASYYVISSTNNGDGTFTASQGGDGSYGSYIKYKFNKPTKISKIYVSNYSDVGQYQRYGVRGNVKMLVK